MDKKTKVPKEKKVKEPKNKEKEKVTTGNKVSFVIGLILCIILVPIIIVNCALIVTSFTNPDKPPALFGYTPMIVLTDSMDPLIKEGDIVISQEVKPGDIKKGDVISFYDPSSSGNAILTHRVIDIYTENGVRYAVTAGDNNADRDYQKELNKVKDDSEKRQEVVDKATIVEDENEAGYTYVIFESHKDPKPVELNERNIIGKYVYTRVPVVGKISMFMQTTWGWVICIAVPLLAFVAYELISRRKNDKSKKNDMDALLAELEALKAEKEAANKPASEEPEANNTDAEVADATETADPPSEE
jgi:signal peptidase